MSSVAAKHLKSLFRRNRQTVSFKEFVKQLLQEDNDFAKSWMDHKSGDGERKAKALRLKNKGKVITEQKLATKAARRKSKASSPKPTT